MSSKPAAVSILALAFAWPAAAQPGRAPPPPAAMPAAPTAAPQSDRLAPARSIAPDPDRWSLADHENMELRVGLFSVGGHFVRDREYQGREPLSGTAGRQNRVAAVGFSLRF